MDIIPFPAKIERQTGELCLTREITILTDTANRWNADYLRGLLAAPTGFPLRVQTGGRTAKNVIRLRLDPTLDGLGREGYRLEVRPEVIVIEAPGTAGVFYGIQTLRQLLPVEIEERRPVSDLDWRVPCVLIEDRPRFAWRGFMLDEGRHFQGKETAMLTLDLMALQKLNVLHWHLTEDQGWRIEIKKYPKLTKIGSQRTGMSKTFLGKQHDGIPHSGFYAQDEIREIVAYAAERHITIVPEVEMPGHSLAALASYPELSCTGGPFEVATHFGIFPDIYCAGKETVFTFLQEVLDEILELFPSPFIHIGGDEAPKKRWKGCPDCQRRIREVGLKDEHALQVYFTNRIAAYLDSKGRHVMGWNEILQDGLVKGAVVQFWRRGHQRLLDAIRNEKRAVVMSTYLDAYLDHSYRLMPLSRAYRYEPVPAELDENETGNILGLEFPLWSEWVLNRARLDYQAYPRLTAMAETGWTPKDKKDFKDFHRRLEKFLTRLDRLGVRYAPLNDAEPPKVRQWFGIFTILQPQTRTAE
ncbi:MAG TPA: beta-N-acetylhexosaminidase [Anaerolineales bacterium]